MMLMLAQVDVDVAIAVSVDVAMKEVGKEACLLQSAISRRSSSQPFTDSCWRGARCLAIKSSKSLL
jgi:hypothetical protein